jgi:hypothetical protein
MTSGICTPANGRITVSRSGSVALTDIVASAIESATACEPRLPQSILDIDGMSSPKGRHLLNRLVATVPECRYLEIGTWKGSTFCSALHGNHPVRALAMDNFSIFGDVRDEFRKNTAEHIGELDMLDADLGRVPGRVAFYDMDCFSHEASTLLNSGILGKFNLYFYDGRHTVEAQFRAFTFYDAALADEFVTVVDDWNESSARVGTIAAFKTMGYETVAWHELKSSSNGDVASWWNGMLVAVVRKRGQPKQRCPNCGGTDTVDGDTVRLCKSCHGGYVYR